MKPSARLLYLQDEAPRARAVMREESGRLHREQIAGRRPNYAHYQRLYGIWRRLHDEFKIRYEAEVYGDEPILPSWSDE